MGLDQYAFRVDEETGEEGGRLAFQWRKHAKLQQFMEETFVERADLSAEDLNCGRLELTHDDIDRLEHCLNEDAMPESAGGFFYGHQMQDEQEAAYREQDRAFCAWARETLNDNATPVYSCWW